MANRLIHSAKHSEQTMYVATHGPFMVRRDHNLQVHPQHTRYQAVAVAWYYANMTRPVLIVDDEEHIRELVAHYLTREGFAVEQASTGPQALEMFAQVQPSLVVLDIMLPGLSGTEVCREIRKTSTVPILMLTARDDIVDKVVGFELGADDYLTKPFEPKELVVRVKALQRRVQAGAE